MPKKKAKKVTQAVVVETKDVGTKLGKQGAQIKAYDSSKPEEMSLMALTLATHIAKRKLSTNIKGKNYAHVEGWQFAGGMLGFKTIPCSMEQHGMKFIEEMSTENEIKWKCNLLLVDKNDVVVGFGSGICSDQEKMAGKKRWTDEFAIISMAQTRAIGRAYRNSIGWVMNLAGYEVIPDSEAPEAPQSKEEKEEMADKEFNHRLKMLQDKPFTEEQLTRQLEMIDTDENLSADQKKKITKVINEKLKK